MKLQGKEVLVAGANGMVAFQLIKLLKNKNCSLTLTDLHEEVKYFAKEKYISGDLRSREFANEICKGIDIVSIVFTGGNTMVGMSTIQLAYLR